MFFSLQLGCLLIFCLWARNVYSQGNSQGNRVAHELLVAEILEDLDTELDLQELSERLHYYLRNPIRLNNTDERELMSLFFLSSQQVTNILQHRDKSGAFVSILELQAVLGMDAVSLARLYPFVSVGDQELQVGYRPAQVYAQSTQQIMLRYARVLERQAGYTLVDSLPSRYLGDANRYWLWYRLNYKDRLKISFNAKKDAGEPFFRYKQRYGFDHYGFSIALKRQGIVRELLLGDYAMQIGQGLILWNGFSFNKSAIIGGAARQGMGLKAYTAMHKTNFLRGAAVRIQLHKLGMKAFLSHRHLTANVIHTDSGRYVTHISSAGLHRTATEQSYRRALRESILGLNISYQQRRFKAGIALVNSFYNASINTPKQLRNRFDRAGSQFLNLGLNLQYTYQNIFMYMETAVLLSGGWASSAGFIASLHPQLSVFSHYRKYQVNYYAHYAQGFAEGSRTANENGLYAGLVFHPSRQLEWLAYADVFHFPWLGYRVDAPSEGLDLFTQLSYRWHKLGRLLIRYRYRLREENRAVSSYANVLADVIRDQGRIAFQYKLSSRWELRAAAGGTRFRKDQHTDYGMLFYQDVFWRNDGRLRQLNLRAAWFSTDSYDARLYAFEQDVLYGQGFRVVQNRGLRCYLNMQYQLGKQTTLWLRYAQTAYSGAQSIGTGLDRSNGNKRTELKVQIRYQW